MPIHPASSDPKRSARGSLRAAFRETGNGIAPAEEAAAAAEREENRSDLPGNTGNAELEELRSENEKLYSHIAEMRQEHEALIEQKTELIRQQALRIQELESQPAPSAAPKPHNEQELLALSDELERDRRQLELDRKQMDDERRQLQDDEDSMMKQMREMELQMAKERADLARQRNDLQRLHGEIRHELELAQRNAAVNERLQMLQRRHQEAASGKPGESGERPAPPKKPAPEPQQQQPPPPPPKKDSGSGRSGFFGFFGKKGE